MAPKIVDKKMKRLEIAAAAGLLFGKYGLEKVTIDDVAEAAGIGKGTVYEYFRNKDSLIHGAFEILLAHMEEEIAKSMDLTETPLGALKKSTFSLAEVFEHVGDQYGFFMEYMLLLSRGQADASPLRHLLEAYRKMVTGLLEAAIDAGQVRGDIDVPNTAAAYAAWFDGAIFHWMTLPNPDMKTMAAAFWEFFSAGIAGDKAEVR